MDSMLNFLEFIGYSLLEKSTLSKTGIPKEMVRAIHQKEEHRSEKYKLLGKVHKAGKPQTIPYEYFKPEHDIEVSTPFSFTGRPVPPPPGSTRKSSYTDFAQYLQDIKTGPISVLITRPEDEIYIYLYNKKKWGGGPGVGEEKGGQQYALIVWDRDQKKAVDYGFYGLTTEGAQKRLVRPVHSIKGGNTNQKLQEFVYNLGEGAPKRDKPVMVYDLMVTKKPREVGKERRSVPLSMDLIRLFVDRLGPVLTKPAVSTKVADRLEDAAGRSWIQFTSIPGEVEGFATDLGIQSKTAISGLYKLMVEFREKMWKEGGGNYQKTSGFDLEQETEALLSGRPYTYGTEWDPEDTRKTPVPGRRGQDMEKTKRRLPKSGDYAAIDSMIKEHTLDGVLNRFAAFVLTGKIVSPKETLSSKLGLKSAEEEGYEEWS